MADLSKWLFLSVHILLRIHRNLIKFSRISGWHLRVPFLVEVMGNLHPNLNEDGRPRLYAIDFVFLFSLYLTYQFIRLLQMFPACFWTKIVVILHLSFNYACSHETCSPNFMPSHNRRVLPLLISITKYYRRYVFVASNQRQSESRRIVATRRLSAA